MIQTAYKPLLKQKSFNPSPVAGRIPHWADEITNPRCVGTTAHLDFWEEQIDRCINGYITAGVDIPGRYYYYLNFMPLKGLMGGMYPMYVDLDLEYFKLIEYVKKHHKMGVISPKARRKGLSEKGKTILSHGIRFIEGYRGAITAGLETYVTGLRKKFEHGENAIRKEFRLNNLTDNEKVYQLGYDIKDPIGGYIEDGFGGMLSFETMYDDPSKLEGEYFHDVICEESGQYKLLGEVIESIKPALMFGAQMKGTFLIYGCVCAGTKVWNNNGSLVNIEDLNPFDGILGFDGAKVSKENIIHWQPPAEKECFRIETEKGRILECSHDHPILWSNKAYMRGPHGNLRKSTKFVKVENIKVGDQIATIEEVPIFGEKEIIDPRFVGWLIGDGSYGFDKTPVLSNCDDEINNYVEFNYDTAIEREFKTKDGRDYKEMRIRGICSKLRSLGIYGQTKTKKRFPKRIHSCTKKVIAELLGGLFDTDGHVNDKSGGYKITLTSSSQEMLKEVLLLLQKFGIHAGISRIKANPKSGKGGTKDYFRLEVRDKKSVIRFRQEISFVIKYKQERLNFIADKCENWPIAIRRGRPVVMNKGVPGLRFERVVSIEPIGMKPIYNLTAGNTHTYIANGIVTHNTGGNILSTSKDFKDLWDNADTYDLEKFWVPGTRLFFPFFGNKLETTFEDPDKEGLIIDAIPNLKKYKPYQIIGCEDIKAAEEFILRKRIEYAKLPNKKKLKKHNQSYPLTVEEAFTSGGSNNFNDELIYEKLFEIEGKINNYKEVVLEWVRDEQAGEENDYKRLAARPARKDDADWKKIMVLQEPRKDIIDLDVGGVDSYNQDQTRTSASLGSMIVVRQGNRVNMVDQGIRKAEYPVCLYYHRPPRKEQFYDMCLKIAVWYGLKRNVMCSAEQDFVIDYFVKNGGTRYLAPRPKTFDSKKTQQVHKYGAKILGSNKEIILGVVQSMIEDYVMDFEFPLLLRDMLAYDEEYIGTDWDSVDALAYAKMRIEDMRTRPRKSSDDEEIQQPIEWKADAHGNMILVRHDTPKEEKKDIHTRESSGGWRPGFTY